MQQKISFVQLTVSNVSPETDADELLETLEGQLALSYVQLDRSSLRVSEDGRTKEAVILLTHDEATFLLGPMKKAKVRLADRIVELHFEPTGRRRSSQRPSSRERRSAPTSSKPHPESTSPARGPLEITGLGTPSLVLDEKKEPALADSIPMGAPYEPDRLPEPSRPKSLLDQDLTSEETIDLLKALSLKRRMKTTRFSPENGAKPDQVPAAAPPPLETVAWPMSMIYSPAPSLPALPELHAGDKGSKGGSRGTATTPAVNGSRFSRPPEDLPPEVATEGSEPQKEGRICWLGSLFG